MYNTLFAPKHSRGVALITALLVVALVTIIAVGMAARQQVDIRRAGNILDGDQAYLFTLGVESWAQGVLAQDFRDGQTKNKVSDTLNEDWATALPPIEVAGGKVAGKIEDLQGRFNLNNLWVNNAVSQPDLLVFQRLLANLHLDPDLVYAVIDWIDVNVDQLPNGAEDLDYLDRKPSYRTANAPMVSSSELALVKGFTPEIVKALEPYVTALPLRAPIGTGSPVPLATPINVNTAPAPVLAALVANLDAAGAARLLDVREGKGFETITQFTDIVGADKVTARADISSNHFLVTATGEAGRGQVQLHTLLYRDPTGKVQVLMRGIGDY